MQAAVLEKYNEPLQIEELSVERPRAGEVAVRILAAGVCHSDLYVLEGATPVPPPLVPGHEAVGVVEEVGQPSRASRRVTTWCLASSGLAAGVKTASPAGRIFAKILQK